MRSAATRLSVAQAAIYTLGQFGEMRDAVIATMDTGSRTWDHEVIPAPQAGAGPAGHLSRWLEPLSAHHDLHGPDPDALPDRDFFSGQLAVPVLPLPERLPAWW